MTEKETRIKDFKNYISRYLEPKHSLFEVFGQLKQNEHFVNVFRCLPEKTDIANFINCLQEAFKEGFASGVNYADLKNADDTIKEVFKAEEKPSEAPFEKKEEVKEEVQAYKKSDYITATVAAEASCSVYEDLKAWCCENNKRRYGKGYLLNRDDYRQWCEHIGAESIKDSFPNRRLLSE